MSSIAYDLSKIKAFILDMDGVISCTISPLGADGNPMRTVNVKDGYAMQHAVKHGYIVAILSGGRSQAMELRAKQLGLQYVFMGARHKMDNLKELMEETGLKPEEICYIGDDLPDVPVMEAVGLAVAPADAVPEAKEAAQYISQCYGGHGVVRDVIEQTMRCRGDWGTEVAFGW
ncbi:3-deoxy-D-manno-octulosonate 8-phosphate phosphatase [Porphyromonas macacae]|uniref:3-deoxy-D-manno-octulosonate 8-phosphate phosphatase n=1 Tax=Porphyromonas macacae TaxID=28115 RepID=A0A0A2E095_9PORP|nr:HAD-IIIA family hydrolase [Porphyromonas macacae]KGN72281.1 3-deoxy-D-manno-octulosonate 8-phosphate phosphatase [Porphyromonas macacae]KGN97672.1 3-deoxy-D-manno-octulosonate 8-phosphate phosphatase [Porphyromonas macacae]SUB77259.1 3-deoxy-D-manno-octulosonate 8-phosphate phosphatase KdsC [Porphyromonas macacae]SUB88360.1 3-deoxy-D-manno-octulosonate 8-phosphate phosphatase KdsC [Porphyromonas macacae]